ncbi:MAG: FAD-binding oxidoreductase [Cyanobacteria bacterium REEB67]|nr:FAD-binding oxidoreductase [Cyanobacteria bacterium REEB67]
MNRLSNLIDMLVNTTPLGELVNDRHSRLNPTVVARVERPGCTFDLVQIVRDCKRTGSKICIAGGRHAMGGQQFAAGAVLVDMTEMRQVHYFDRKNGLIKVDAGMRWPELIDYLQHTQSDRAVGRTWTIRQKQTGCDTLSLGGALSANVHGRGLHSPPIVADVESFELVTAGGDVVNCSRTENIDLFVLAIGGYGMFGPIATATLRLAPLTLLRRSVQVATSDIAVDLLERAAADGALYGDFQFNIDHDSKDFLQNGIVSTYRRASETEAIAPANSVKSGNNNDEHKALSLDDWHELVYLAHADKARAFQKYQRHYLASDGQTYWSDTFQLATYLDDYHRHIDHRLGAQCPGTEMISELYVPRHCLALFLERASTFLKSEKASVIYGTVRMIEKDTETFLPWATENFACIVFNLHVDHSPAGQAAARRWFCGLIDLAVSLKGSYYLTYHRWASAPQLLACYPQIERFLERKERNDPDQIFYSDWFGYLLSLLKKDNGPLAF